MSSKKNAVKHDGRHAPAKKYSKHDANLQKNNGLTFAIAMVLTLLAVYFVIEVEVPKEEVALNEPEVLDEDVTYTISEFKIYEEVQAEKIVKQQKKKVVIPLELDIVPDDTKLDSGLDLDVAPETTGEPFNPDNVIVDNGPGDDFKIPADLVEKVPMFEECLDVPEAEQRMCFEEGMKEHVRKTFRYPGSAVDLGLSGKVYTTFTIDKNGNIVDLQLRGPHKILEKEATRIIGKLPKMVPGKQGIHNVNVTFSMPITFQLK
ncbi:energy transducer TonB [Spongiivirga citrea]|uniref:TonB family protein n=1 Tax=Spongiivirga citrea TaxID=1481457 RepID=A0A6M0CMQ9_9FLAO|nr:energy transducer TonB [Spongiivirga citrea]NER18233.1 TonB family protein [Spongiivirga citrea]